MRYHNETTDEWYYGGSMTRMLEDGSLFSGYPTVEQLEAWGFVEVEDGEEPADPLQQAKNNKLAEIFEYDQSAAVNEFSINGNDMWLDAPTRQQLRISIEAYQAVGATNVTKWFEGTQYTFPITTWLQMLNALEVYAAEALNVTEQHRANVTACTTVADVDDYDYTTGYPTKLAF